METSHEIDYEIGGSDLQYVTVELDPGETVVAEPGAMLFMEQGIKFTAKLGDGTDAALGKIAGMVKRKMAGESIWVTHFSNRSDRKRKVAFGSEYPGKIVALDLSALGGKVIAQKEAFLCAAYGTRISVSFTKKLGAGFFGGEGFILQSLLGDGMVFCSAGGAIIEHNLEPNETIALDTGSLVAVTETVEYNITLAGGVKAAAFGGEGLWLAELKGPGTVWSQSLPFSKFADKIMHTQSIINVEELERMSEGQNRYRR